MFKNIYKLLFGLLMVALISSNITVAQTTSAFFNSGNIEIQKNAKIIYPIFSISPVGGIQFPIGSLNDNFKSSFNAGLEVNMKVNKETSFFLKGGYYNMPVKDDVIGPDGSFIEITVGPRYTFTSPNIKAQFFLEAGLGAYIFATKDYTFVVDGTSYTIPSTSKANFGVNVGPGVIIPLGGAVDFLVKAKLHYVFTENNASTFLGAIMGLDFRL
jgi:hypothetical protein